MAVIWVGVGWDCWYPHSHALLRIALMPLKQLWSARELIPDLDLHVLHLPTCKMYVHVLVCVCVCTYICGYACVYTYIFILALANVACRCEESSRLMQLTLRILTCAGERRQSCRERARQAAEAVAFRRGSPSVVPSALHGEDSEALKCLLVLLQTAHPESTLQTQGPGGKSTC
jgi:hypothetical protein